MENLTWLHNKAISAAEIARRIDMDPSLFTKKMNGRPVNKNRPAIWQFTQEEIEKIKDVKDSLIQELRIT